MTELSEDRGDIKLRIRGLLDAAPTQTLREVENLLRQSLAVHEPSVPVKKLSSVVKEIKLAP